MTEDLRLQAVTHFNTLDIDNDPELQEIVELAAAISNTPYAMITFLDEGTQYLKVCKGTAGLTIAREISFCSYVIEQYDLMFVPDTLEDERFINNPMVAGKPGIRFYAGAPLTTGNKLNIGTLCVLDTVPHLLNAHQQMVLKILANQVVKTLELRGTTELLQKSQQELSEQKKKNDDANTRLRSLFESSTNFHVLLGKKGEVIYYNKTAYNFINAVHHAKLTQGDKLAQYIHPSFLNTFLEKYQQALQGVKSLEEGSTDYEQLGVISWEASFEPAYDSDNEITGISYLIRNVTDQKLKVQKIIAQNESLLKIAHIQAHEFRGPLTTIMGLINLIQEESYVVKEENYVVPAEYFKYLEQTVNKLDSAIKQIVNDVDDTVVDGRVGFFQ